MFTGIEWLAVTFIMMLVADLSYLLLQLSQTTGTLGRITGTLLETPVHLHSVSAVSHAGKGEQLQVPYPSERAETCRTWDLWDLDRGSDVAIRQAELMGISHKAV